MKPSRKPETGPFDGASLWEVVALPEPGGRRRWLLACAVVIFVVAAGGVLAWRSEPTVADWAAAIALRIHNELDDDRSVTLEPPPLPPAEPPPPPSVPSPPPPTARAEAAPRALRAPSPKANAPGPAKAQALAGAAEVPVDFSDLTFAAGTSPAAGFGRVSGSGVNEGGEGRNGAAGKGSVEGGKGRGPAWARAVTLSEDAWDCPWPSSADEHERDEAEVDLQVEVAPDGRASQVRILRDPGFGFGPAARICALRTAFTPALDPRGQPVVAWSPTIRVTFRR